MIERAKTGARQSGRISAKFFFSLSSGAGNIFRAVHAFYPGPLSSPFFSRSSGRYFSVVYGGLGRSVTREKSGTSRALLLLPMPSAKLPTKKKKDAWEPGYMNSFHSHSCCMISFYCKGFADNFFSNLPLLLPPEDKMIHPRAAQLRECMYSFLIGLFLHAL